MDSIVATARTIVDQLINLFNDPSRHITGYFALDKEHFMIEDTSDEAYAFCLKGGINHFARDVINRVFVRQYISDKCKETKSMQTFNSQHPGVSFMLTKFNDIMGREAVIQMLREAKEKMIE